MIFVGLVLLAVATVAAVDLIIQNTHHVTLHAFGHTWTFGEYWLLVVGVVIAFVGLVGLGLMAASARSGRRARRERRALARENARLNATQPTTPPTTPPSGRDVPADGPPPPLSG
jgi:uncharacterized integral membrane protein